MIFLCDVLGLVALAGVFGWAAIRQPVAAYLAMYPVAVFAAILLVSLARRRRSPSSLADPLRDFHRRSLKGFLIGCSIAAVSAWLVLLMGEKQLPRAAEKALSLIAPGLSILVLILLLRFLDRGEKDSVPD